MTRTTTPSADAAQALLEGLVQSYARTESLVGHRMNLTRLAKLRALEHAGLVEIKVVVLEKRWVVTAAGAIWLALRQEDPAAPLNLDRDILCGMTGYWMTRTEAVEGMMRLRRDDLCSVTRLDGGVALDPCHAEVLLHLEAGDPLSALPRFSRVKESA